MNARNLVAARPVVLLDLNKANYPVFITLCNKGRNKDEELILSEIKLKASEIEHKFSQYSAPLIKTLADLSFERLSEELISKKLIKREHLADFYNHPAVIRSLNNRLRLFVQQHFEELCSTGEVYLKQSSEENGTRFARVRPAEGTCMLMISVKKVSDDQYTVSVMASCDGVIHAPVNLLAGHFVQQGECLYRVDDTRKSSFIAEAQAQSTFSGEDLAQFLNRALTVFQVHVDLELDASIAVSSPLPNIIFEFDRLLEVYLRVTPRLYYTADPWGLADKTAFVCRHGEVSMIQRNGEIESSARLVLQSLHPDFGCQEEYAYSQVPEEMLAPTIAAMKEKLSAVGYAYQVASDLPDVTFLKALPRLRVKSSRVQDWFDLEIETLWDNVKVPLMDIIKAINSGKREVEVAANVFVSIPQGWEKKFSALLSFGTVQENAIRIQQKHYLALAGIEDELDEPASLELEDKRRRLRHFDQHTLDAPPAAVSATLRPYQLVGYNWLRSMHQLGWGSCLADDMGLGKTLQVISFLQYLKEQGENNKPSLLVLPTSLIYNWVGEIRKFCPALSYVVYYGSSREKDQDRLLKPDLVITTYGVVRNDVDFMETVQWNYIILDESHTIRNFNALQTQAVYRMKGLNRIILSGTPIQNNLLDLHTQFNFINPGFFPPREKFTSHFVDRQGALATDADELQKIIAPFMLRRTKKQVAADLPEKTEVVLWCEMSHEQKEVYEAFRTQFLENTIRQLTAETWGKNKLQVLAGITRLRQICNSPALLGDDQYATMPSAKIDLLLDELVLNLGDSKMIIFSQFTSMLGLIRKALDERGLAYCCLDGQTTARQRQEQVDIFQREQEPKLFLVSLMAGGVGLNLTAAEYVVLVDPWWNPAVENQAIDRCYRIGQTKKVFAYRLICRNTIEEKILGLQQYKKELSDSLISEATGENLPLDLEGLKRLLA